VRAVAVDFDGVIHAYSEGWKDGTIYDVPMGGAVEGLQKLMEFFAVFVHTTRQPYPVAQWLEEHGIPAFVELESAGRPREFWDEQGRVLVTNRKLPAFVYIDDRAIRSLDWDQALADVFGLPR
jgi:hypothetical protein